MTDDVPQKDPSPATHARSRHPSVWDRLLVIMNEPQERSEWFVGIDIGGSASRLRAVSTAGDVIEPQLDGPGDPLVSDGVGCNATRIVTDFAGQFIDEVRQRTGRYPIVAAAAVGLRGMRAMVGTGVLDPDALHNALAEELTTQHTAVASDAVTAHLGALGGGAGISLTVGTGVVVVSMDRARQLRMADGIGPHVGDSGAGVWIGEEGMRAAGRWGFGVSDTSSPVSQVLYDVALREFGPMSTWDHQFSTPERSLRLTRFTPHVLEAARRGDPGSRSILERAADHLADSVVAALTYHPDAEPLVAASGGLMRADSPLRAVVANRLAARAGVNLAPGAGEPVAGAVALARLAAVGESPVVGTEWMTVARHYTDENVVRISQHDVEAGWDRSGSTRSRKER